MNKESSTLAPDTAIACPAWCTSTDDEHDEGTHYGPDFGDVTPQLLEDGNVGAFLPQYEGALTADELRKHADDVLVAAEWIEAYR